MFSLKNWKQDSQWTNWSNNIVAYPTQFFAPKSVEEIQHIVTQMNKQSTIRVTGAAHSFSPIAMPESSALTLHHLRGLISIDKENQTATFYAGTYLHEIGPILARYQLALSNMGDIETQTLAGVIATGTHGTGITLGSFSSMVTKWGIVNGLGEYIEHERGDDELSEALHVSVGLLGILVTVTIQVIPLYSLHYVSRQGNLQEELANFQHSIRVHRHLEWFYFPGSERIQVKTMDTTSLKEQSKWQQKVDELKLQLLENGAFYVASEICKRQPRASKAVSKISSKLISEGERTGLSYTMFPSPRKVKFNETEYAIPLSNFEACMEEVHHTLKSQQFHVHFPIECRTTTGEMGYLSPTQRQESAFIAFHMYKGMDETAYFEWIRIMMKKYNGRPHWGKINDYDKSNIRNYYPNFDKFEKVRQKQDPHNIFLTTYFQHIFDKQ